MRTVRGLAADESWRAPLASAAARASVVSSFDRALNLRLDDQLLTVLASGARRAPGGLVTDAPVLPLVAPGAPVTVHGGLVRIDAVGLVVDARTCDSFSCRTRPVPGSRSVPAGAISRSRSALTAVLRPGSFVPGPDETAFQLAIRKRLELGCAAYQSALAGALASSAPADRTDDRLGSAVGALVGLGVGLTPSGDDYLVGSLAVLHHAGLVSAADAVAGCCEELIPATTDVGGAYLAAAAAGRFHEDLAAAAVAVLATPTGDLRSTFERVARIGATSGTDALHGLVDTLASVVAADLGWPADGPFDVPLTQQGALT